MFFQHFISELTTDVTACLLNQDENTTLCILHTTNEAKVTCHQARHACTSDTVPYLYSAPMIVGSPQHYAS
jgi:hypothetical protein